MDSGFWNTPGITAQARSYWRQPLGQTDSAIARDLEVNRNTVILWRARFEQEGLDSLWEVARGRGRKPTYGPEKIEAIVDATHGRSPKG